MIRNNLINKKNELLDFLKEIFDEKYQKEGIYYSKILSIQLKSTKYKAKVYQHIPYTYKFKTKKSKNSPDRNKDKQITPLIKRKNILLTYEELERIKMNTLQTTLIKSNQESVEFKNNISKLAGKSQRKHEAQKTAKILAKGLWTEDQNQTIRLGEMADRIYCILFEMGYDKELPELKESFKDWIKDLAPSYARTGGRPSKEK